MIVDIRVAALVLSLLPACSILPWPGDPAPPVRSRRTSPFAEPKLADAVEGMILQTYYLYSSSVGDRVAVRRCGHVDGSVDRCEIAFVVLGRIVDRVPTFVQPAQGTSRWEEQGKAASKAVQKTIERVLEDDRIALARTGVFGVAELSEGLMSTRVVDGRVELVAGSPARVLATAQAPGMQTVLDSYVSQRAPNVRAVRVGDRDQRGPEAIVVFRRVAANDWRVAAVVPPLDGWPANATTGAPPIGVARDE
jgi:hypothetical protein